MVKRRSVSIATSRFLLLASTAVLVSLGIVMILNASSVQAFSNYGDAYYWVKRQLIWTVVGVCMMLLVSRMNYRLLVKYSLVFIAGAVVALVLSHVPGIGQSAKGASRAIGVGLFSFQPSEPAKLAVLLYLASALSANRKRLHDIRALLGPGVVVVLVLGLVVAQPDLGTTVLLALTALTMLFLGGVRLRHVIGLTVATGLAGTVFALSAEYRRNRILAFLNPSIDPLGIGYQIRQSLIGLGSGGLTGVGLGMSRQKFFFLPEPHTDFIFAIIGEELGLVGTVLVVVTFGILIYAGLNIAFKTNDYVGKILAAGITASIAGQALINLGAVTSVLPVTGVPLPLVSSGGSSLTVTLVLIGILLNISSKGRRGRSAGSHEGDSQRGRDGGPRLSGSRAFVKAGIR